MSEAGRPRASSWSTTMPCSGPGCGPSWATRSSVVGEADEVDAAVELINERVPDVVLLDVHLPGGGGQAVLAGVHARTIPRCGSSPCRCPTPPRT